MGLARMQDCGGGSPQASGQVVDGLRPESGSYRQHARAQVTFL